MRLKKYADLLPLLAWVIVVVTVFLFDRERADHELQEETRAQSVADQQARDYADKLGNEIAARMGSFVGAKTAFLSVQDSISERTFLGVLDSLTNRFVGVNSLSLIYPDERILRTPQTQLGRYITLDDETLRAAYQRSLVVRAATASNVVDYGQGKRVYVFDPVVSSDSTAIIGVLGAEFDPSYIWRAAVNAVTAESRGVPVGTSHALFGPDTVPLSTQQNVPATWKSVWRSVPVANTAWLIRVGYQPPDLAAYRYIRIVLWAGGVAVAFAVAIILYFLRRTIATQKEEIARRQAAEEAARNAEAEARERAKEARDLAAQLEAAHSASQRLSTSLDPDDVVELFLGGIAEILDADVASLYTFEEEGELLVGRRRMVFRDVEGVTDRLRNEDIRQVSAPVAMLPTLGEAVSTGEPYVVENAAEDDRMLGSRAAGQEAASASVTVPLLIAGHTVGVASWEMFSGPRRFPAALIAFAQALAAPAAAALRTAELFLSLETERRRAAREAVRFGAVLDQMADGVIVVDAAGRLERSNESAEELLGEDLAEAPVEEWPARFELVSIEGRPLSPADFPLTRGMRGERVRRSTFIVRSEWGTERHLSGSAGPILGAAGELGGAAMVIRDVTDEHQYAEMLRHTNRELRRQADVLEQVNHQLREATKAKDQFLAVMSHELRTPINAIMGYSDLLDLGVKGALNDDQRAMLSRVRETSRHLLGLINEVLDLAKIGAGRMDLVMADLAVGQMVDRAAQQVLPLTAAKGLALRVPDAGAQPLVIVRADETRLTQIIVNLLSNAVKFTNAGHVTVEFAAVAGRVHITVRDTGPGIPRDQAERIFEEFYQVEGGLSRTSGGTGLGLAIARRFARLMHGDITVDSEVGKGSTFTLQLPGAEAGGIAATSRTETTVAVLSHQKQALTRLMEDLSGTLRVVGATQPGELATVVRREAPCFVAIDAMSDDHAAWRAIAALQADPATAVVPVLLFAHDDDEAESIVDLGMLTVLSKPLTVEHASDVILAAVDDITDTTVLVADDDADVRRILGEALAAAGCAVITAASGGELLEVARRERPDIAVIDLLMPGMDGIEAIAAMRSEHAFADMRLFALLSREMPTEEMNRLSESMATLRRGRRVRPRLTAKVLRLAAEASAGAPARGAAA
ncbi:MAG TPA: ATP-binding protein [Longimicrobiales bacterium]|nr:ATP-binding protein [Longimicrobiales bacterium]